MDLRDAMTGTGAQRDEALRLFRFLIRQCDGVDIPGAVRRFAASQTDKVLRSNLERAVGGLLSRQMPQGSVLARSSPDMVVRHFDTAPQLTRAQSAPSRPTVRLAPPPVSRRRRGR
jgi:hypothetical protein